MKQRSKGVELIQRGQVQDQLDGLDHAGLRIAALIHELPSPVRADYLGQGAVPVHVVQAKLSVVLNHEDAGLESEPAARQALDDAAQGPVVVGHHGLGRWEAGRRCRLELAPISPQSLNRLGRKDTSGRLVAG